MVKSKKITTTIHDCTIIKIGGSYAISLPVKKLEDDGFALGMPVDATLEFDEALMEPVEDYTDQIEEYKDYIANYDTLPFTILNSVCDELGLNKVKDDNHKMDQKSNYLIELKSHLKFMEKEMKDVEKCMDITSDDFDYDKSGDKTIGL